MFPEDIAGEVYAHDVIGRATLTAYKRQAKVQAAILGEGDIDDTESSEWLISEPCHPMFGEKVEERLLNNEATGLTFNTKGVVVLDGEETFIERVLSKDGVRRRVLSKPTCGYWEIIKMLEVNVI